MKKKVTYAGLFIIVMQLPHITYGNDLNQKLRKLEIGLVALLKQIQPPVAPEPSPQKKPKTRPRKPASKKRAPGTSQQPRKTPAAPAPAAEVPTQELGKQVLDFTNQFRAQNNKPPLQWNQTLADLSTEHSQNMATGKVPFSHDGFQNRATRARFSATAENVFMTSPRKDLAKLAVDSWISSPGHRNNLLGNYRYCGIGGFKNSKGQWFFTQMFGK